MSASRSIATRTGDDGSTSLLYGQRVAKDHPQIEAVGAFDELNAAIGFAKATSPDAAQKAALELIQKDLVALMGELACAEADVARYERRLADLRLADLAREGLHPTRGSISVQTILDLIVVEHLEEHCAQLRELIAVAG